MLLSYLSSRRPRIKLFLRDCQRRSRTILNKGHACARVARPVRHHLSNTKFTAVRYDQVGEAVARLLVETADLISHPRVVHFATEAVSTIVFTSLCCTFPCGCSRSDWSFRIHSFVSSLASVSHAMLCLRKDIQTRCVTRS